MSRVPTGRTKIACQRCNRKKVRCDVQVDLENPDTVRVACTACTTAGVRCERRSAILRQHSQEETERTESHESENPTTDYSSSEAFLGSTGYLDLLLGSDSTAASQQRQDVEDTRNNESEPRVSISASAQRANTRIYFQNFYVWCPVLDPTPTDANSADVDSQLLSYALASLAGTVTDDNRAAQDSAYQHARQLFYAPEGPTALKRIIASTLFRSNSGRSTDVLGTDSGFWWTGIAIRLAQTIGLHLEISSLPQQTASLRRRVWWTLYARERVTALCQGRPCIIDDDYCDVRPPQLADFPSTKQHEATIFIHWVRLSIILGTLNKQLFVCRRRNLEFPTAMVMQELKSWVSNLPEELGLTIPIPQHTTFDRHVHLLYIPYLAAVTTVYLKTSGSSLPRASVTATIAASCTARIMEELMARGALDLLWGEVAWFVAVAILALTQVSHVPSLSTLIDRDIIVLKNVLRYLAQTRSYAKLIQSGLEKAIMTCRTSANTLSTFLEQSMTSHRNDSREADSLHDDILWTELMPFANIAAASPTANSNQLLVAVIARELTPISLIPPTSMDFADDAREFWSTIDFLTGEPLPIMGSELDIPMIGQY